MVADAYQAEEENHIDNGIIRNLQDRIDDLESALRAALSFIQEKHADHSDRRAVMVIAAVRGALCKDRD